MVEIKKNNSRTHEMKGDFERTEVEKLELMMFELNKKLAILEDFKNEIQYRLDKENQK